MAFLKIISENKDLSWVLEKNPERGIVIKSNHAGYLFGFFPEKDGKTIPNEYCIFFKDKSDEISYKKNKWEQFEYLSSTKYNDARFLNDAIQELLHSARENLHSYLKEDKDYDVPSFHSLTINLLETDFKTVDIFQRYFPNLSIKTVEVSKNNYKITFSNSFIDMGVSLLGKPMTFAYFLNLINLFGIFAVLNSESYIYLSESLIEKYLKILNRIDAPYFIRYLFKIRLLRAEKKYMSNVSNLVKSSLYPITMQFGDTHDMRIAFVKEKLPLDMPIVDIGAGIDFRYMKYYASKLQDSNLPYYAIEIDVNARERIKAACKNRGWNNVEVFESLDDFLLQYSKQEKVNVLCTEVLEHNDLKEAEVLIGKVQNEINFEQFIITVPNYDFNKFYGMDSNFRHPDHKWELGEKDFKKFITDNSAKLTTIGFHRIGDTVEEIAVTHGAILKNKNKI